MVSDADNEPDIERVANYRRILMRAVEGMPDQSVEARRRVYDRALEMAERAKGTTRSGAENLLAMNVAIASLEAGYEAQGPVTDEVAAGQSKAEVSATALVPVPRFAPEAIDAREMTLKAIHRQPAQDVADVLVLPVASGPVGERASETIHGQQASRRLGSVLAGIGAVLLAGVAIGYVMYDDVNAPRPVGEPEISAEVTESSAADAQNAPEPETPSAEPGEDTTSPTATETVAEPSVPVAPVPAMPPKSDRIDLPTQGERAATAIDDAFSRYPNTNEPSLDIPPESERRLRQRAGEAQGDSVSDQIDRSEAEGETLAGETTVAATEPPTAPVVEDRPASLYVTSEAIGDDNPPVAWQVETVSVGDGPQEAILGAVRASDPAIAASIYIRQNVDPSIPASGIVEMVMANDGALGEAVVASLDGVYVRDAKTGPSREVVTFPFEIAPGHFGATFSESESILARNLDLLLQSQWLEFAVTLESGERRRLVIEKGTSGSDVMGAILGPWRASLEG